MLNKQLLEARTICIKFLLVDLLCPNVCPVLINISTAKCHISGF